MGTKNTFANQENENSLLKLAAIGVQKSKAATVNVGCGRNVKMVSVASGANVSIQLSSVASGSNASVVIKGRSKTLADYKQRYKDYGFLLMIDSEEEFNQIIAKFYSDSNEKKAEHAAQHMIEFKKQRNLTELVGFKAKCFKNGHIEELLSFGTLHKREGHKKCGKCAKDLVLRQWFITRFDGKDESAVYVTNFNTKDKNIWIAFICSCGRLDVRIKKILDGSKKKGYLVDCYECCKKHGNMFKFDYSPAGVLYGYQGFENYSLLWLLKNPDIDESMIVNNPIHIPFIKYNYEGKQKNYLTDILIYHKKRPGFALNTPKKYRIKTRTQVSYRFHETKSMYTAFHCNPYEYKKNAAKGRGCFEKGIKWECAIFDDDGALIMLFDDPNELERVGNYLTKNGVIISCIMKEWVEKSKREMLVKYKY